MAISKEDKEWLEKAGLPADVIASAEEVSEEAKRLLEQLLDYKSNDDTGGAEPDEPAEEKPEQKAEEAPPAVAGEDADKTDELYASFRERIMDDLRVSDLQASLGAMAEAVKQLLELKERLERLESELKTAKEEVKALKAAEDEKVASLFAPINWPTIGFSPTRSEDTVVDKSTAEKISKEAPRGDGFTGDPAADLFLRSFIPQGG